MSDSPEHPLMILPAILDDLPDIRAAYEHGRARQRTQDSSVWPPFADAQIVAEIAAGTLFCLLDGTTIEGVFTVLESDPLIWGDEERGAHLYLHRIARASTARAGELVDTIIAWATEVAAARGRVGLRVDTWASNDALISFYVRRGFRRVGTRRLSADPGLQSHYHGTELALLER